MMLSNEQRRIVEENLRLVPFVMNKLRNAIIASGLGMEDARQIGYEALCKAAARWDPERCSVGTYAYHWIFNSIRKACSENSLVRVPSSTLSLHPARRTAVVSLQAPVCVDGTNNLTLEDVLPDNRDTEARALVSEIWDRLSWREQQIVDARLQGRAQSEIAKKIGISQPQVSRCLAAARRKTDLYYAQCAR